MASRSLPRVAWALCLSFLTLQRVFAQTVSPTNDTSGDNDITFFILDTILGGMDTRTNIKPLTPQAGLDGSLDQLKTINLNGPFTLTNAQNVRDLDDGSIAYISCEPSDYADENIDSSGILRFAASKEPAAIILYSTYASQCTFDPDGFVFNMLYTMLKAREAEGVLDGLNNGNPPRPSTSIKVNQRTYNGGSNGSSSGGNVLGKSPTTAVAMIILYSITGIITALFLMIIVIGAVRAHRHPERYGPRRVLGRPRQSRAKGIARAVLETLPIVKFGDQEGDKPREIQASSGRDVELAEQPRAAGPRETTEAREIAATPSTERPAIEGPDVVTTEAHTDTAGSPAGVAETGDKTDQGLACSVCVEDFEQGQDLRVLPCKHRFHPECIDPWLLNVSGTCPLCRVELQPTTSHGTDSIADEGYTVNTAGLPNNASLEPWPQPEIPNGESSRSNRRSRILNTLNYGRMRHATPEERIAALRRLRRENQTSDSIADQGGRSGRRFSRRLSHALGSRPVSRPISEVPPSAIESTFPGSEETTTSPTANTTAPSPTTGTFSRRMSRAFGGSRPVSRPLSAALPSPTTTDIPASNDTTSPTAPTHPHNPIATPATPATGTFSRRMSRALGGSRPASRPISEVPSPIAPGSTEAVNSPNQITTPIPHTTSPSTAAAAAPSTATAAAETEPTPTTSTIPEITPAGTEPAPTSSILPETTNTPSSTSAPAATPAPTSPPTPSGPPRTSWLNSWYRYRS